MASAKKCDRCGKLYEENYNTDEPNMLILANDSSNRLFYDYNSIDLCQECMKKITKFIKGDDL